MWVWWQAGRQVPTHVTQVCPAQVCPAQVYPTQVYPTQVCPAQVPPTQVFPAQVPRHVCATHVCPKQVAPPPQRVPMAASSHCVTQVSQVPPTPPPIFVPSIAGAALSAPSRTSRSNSSIGCGLVAVTYRIVASRLMVTWVASWPGIGDWSAGTVSALRMADTGNSA